MTDIEKSAGSVKNIQSIERAFTILSCFKEEEELGLTEISRMIGLHKSTTSGIVTTMKNLRLLDKNEENGKYRLGLGLFKICLPMKVSVKDIFYPYLKKLSSITNETITMHIWNGGETSVIAEIIESSHTVRYCLESGRDLPLSASAIGKAILAALPEKKKDELLDRMDMWAVTPHSITDRKRLEQELIETRARGYGINREETDEDVVGIGIPFFDGKGRPLGGVGIAGPASRMTEETMERLAQILLDVGGEMREKVSF